MKVRTVFTLLTIAATTLLFPMPMVGATQLQTTITFLGKPPADVQFFPKSVVINKNVDRIAYVVKKENRFLVVTDGKPGPEYSSIGKDTPVFSPDGERIAYTVKDGSSWYTVVDDKKGAGFDAVSKPLFSVDSSRVAFIGQKNEKQAVVVDGKKGKYYDGIAQKLNSPVFNGTANKVAYVALKKKKCSWCSTEKPDRYMMQSHHPLSVRMAAAWLTPPRKATTGALCLTANPNRFLKPRASMASVRTGHVSSIPPKKRTGGN